MFVRVGTCQVLPGSVPAFQARYLDECTPLVRAVEGSIACFIAENVDSTAPLVVCTVWRSEADALAYEASGRAAEVVDLVREFFAAPPTLSSYRVLRP